MPPVPILVTWSSLGLMGVFVCMSLYNLSVSLCSSSAAQFPLSFMQQDRLTDHENVGASNAAN